MNALASWNLSRWNQLNEVEKLRDSLDRLFWPPQVRGREGQELEPRTSRKIEKMKMQTISSPTKKFTGSLSEFAFPAPTTLQVSLAGDFNNWDTKAAPMQKGPDGIWRLSVPLSPGRYEYRFYADGVWQDDPTAQQRAANASGTENCVRIVAA